MYRRLQEHPVAQRKAALAALNLNWGDGRCRFFNPPVDLISLTLLKIAREGGRGILVIPDWPNQVWHPAAKMLCDQWKTFPMAGQDALQGSRTIRQTWRLVIGTIRME